MLQRPGAVDATGDRSRRDQRHMVAGAVNIFTDQAGNMPPNIGHEAPHHRTRDIAVHRDIEIRIEAQPSDVGDSGDAWMVVVTRFRRGSLRAAQAAILSPSQY